MFNKHVTIKTTHGIIEGLCQELSTGQKCDLFLGVPYAKPPIGDLRFEKPERLENWSGVLSAREFGQKSYEMTNWPYSEEQLLVSGEDCLTLNIFTPHCDTLISRSAKREVLVYVHGGGFCSGSSRDYGYNQLCLNFVTSDFEFILVTVQYRLGILGFLTDGSQDVPGNLGLWDQRMAFEFLHKNISYFGGDPDKIIAWGLSAGGASCAALAMSPHCSDLICSSIEMSGTMFSAWSCSDQCINTGKIFIQSLNDLGCNTKWNPKIVKRYLKNKTINELQSTAHRLNISRCGFNILKYHPRIDGDFLPLDILELIAQNSTKCRRNKKPCLMGLTSSEAAYFTLLGKDTYLNRISIGSDQFSSFNESKFRNCVTLLLGESEEFPEALIADASTNICNFYLQNCPSHNVKISEFCLKKYTQLFSDVMFIVPTMRIIRARAQANIPTFLYLNEYFNSQQFSDFKNFELFAASTHSNEYPYLNGLFPVGDFEFNEYDHRHRKLLLQIVSSFVKNGKPSVNEIEEWPVIDADPLKPIRFLRLDAITSQPSISESAEFEESAKFWLNFTDKYHFDLIRNRKTC